jgi:PAS domain S-box-containing protein
VAVQGSVTIARIIRGRLARQLAAVVAVVLAMLLRLALARHGITLPTYITFYPIVLLAALLGGMWTGFLATAFSALLVNYFVLPPVGQFSIRSTSDIVGMVIFCISGVSISLVTELYHRSREKLAAYQIEAAILNERRKVEEAKELAESVHAERERFLDVLETLPAMISLRTPDHCIVFANRSYRERFGDCLGERCFEARFGRTEPCDFCEARTVLETGQPHHWEVIFPDGSLVDAHDFPFTDLDGSSLILEMKADITERRRGETELKEYREHLEGLVTERTRQLQTANAQLELDIRERERAERSLRESRAKLEAALANMPDSVIITDADGRFVEFNDAFARFYRFKSKAECARSFAEFSSLVEVVMANGEPAPPEMYAMRRALRGETAANAEYTLRRKDTGETWIGSISFSPIRDEGGAITGTVITSRDITEDKRAEEERQIAVDFLGMVNQSGGTRDLIQRATTFFQERSGCEAVGIRLREGDNYPYAEARGFSREFVRLENHLLARAAPGKAINDSAGYPFLECLCGSVIQGRIEPSKPFYTAHGSFWTNSTTDLIASAAPADLPSSTRHRCHREGYESVALFPIYVGEERIGLLQLNDRRKGRFSEQSIASWERLAGHLATAISKFRAEEALQESEKRYRNLFNTMNEGFCIIEVLFDADGKPEDYRFLEVNDAFERQTGLHDAVGKRMRELAPAHEAHWFEIYGKVALTGESAHFMNEAKALNRYYDVHAYRVGEPEMRRVAIVFNDFSDYKKAQEALLRSEKLAYQRQQLQALAERLQQAREEERKMVARDLHDQIGQILTAIKMDLTWAARHLPRANVEVHDRLKGSIELINDGVRSVRRICSGLRPGILDDLGLAAAIEWQSNEFAARTGITCQVSVPSGDLRLDSDRSTAIFRIFQECLTNIARHAEARTVSTSLSREAENLLLIVQDDGKGFRESEVAGSLGVLGMKERAQVCGGSVQVSSSPGKGTTVTVRVPMLAASAGREDHEYSDSR